MDMSTGKFVLSCLVITLFFTAQQLVQAQGCVAIRHFSTCDGNAHSSAILHKGDLLVSSSYRYFRSFRHFRGTEEEPDRIANSTEVVNYSHALDLGFSYGLMDRLYLSATLPLVYNKRSSLYEHGRTERHSTFSSGLADMRIGAGYWLLSEESHPLQNIALGLGVKIPTGDAAATDEFQNVGPNGEAEVRPVDQSIQPGDGGWGIILDFQGYQNITGDLSLYANGFYMLNPKETNGTRTYRETLSPILENESIMSVPDQFSVRGGLSYSLPVQGIGFALGVRYEGVPVEDIIGGSEGFRRPGTVFSVEPGVSYMKDRLSLNASVPVALSRNRPQSVTDIETEISTGQPRNGDAAFADYLINVGFSYRFGLLGE